MSVSHRARRHEDRGGDPLDGLVNLFDLGIVLAVAFLLAALSSVNLTEVLTDQEAAAAAQQAVTAAEDEVVNELEVAPGERVVGEGQEVGTVYRLEDGRTVIVRPEDAEAVPGEGESLLPAEPGATPESEPGATTPPEPESGETPDLP
jgi:hypothetical protein